MAETSHSIPMPQDKSVAATQSSADPWTTAEKCLNYFVGAIALMERVGNCLGTLAFTWATVVVLGGLSNNLGKDFWYATAIVFLEAFRVFSRESSRSDDELLFKTTGSIRLKRLKLARGIPYYLTVAIVIVCMYGTLTFSLRHYAYSPPPNLNLQYHILLLSVLLALASVAQAPTAAECLKNHPWLQFFSVLVPVLALGAAMLWSRAPRREVLLIIPPLFVGCLQTVAKQIGSFLKKAGYDYFGQSQFRAWLVKLAAVILPAWIVISVVAVFGTVGVLLLLGTVIVGSLQIPVAVARIVLSSERLFTKYDFSRDPSNQHLEPVLTIFYSMVLAQGILYLAACVLESLLFSPFLTSLANKSNLADKTGYDSINLYYEHAYNKRMEVGVLAQEDTSLVTFAFSSLDSNSNGKKLAAVKILHSLLIINLKGSSNRRLVAEIINNTKVVASLINMLGWTASDDDQQGINIRLLAAKVVTSVAKDLRIVGIPGTMQMVSSLLDVDAKNQDAKQDISNQIPYKKEVNINDNQQQSHVSSTTVDIQEGHGYHAPTNIPESSKQVVAGNKSDQSSIKNVFLECFNSMLCDPQEERESPNYMDFPILGMQILEKLAQDLDNRAEIIRATRLISKIIGFIMNTTDTLDKTMISSFNLVATLVNTEGELGMKIRQQIIEQPFFLNNLVEILVENNRQPKQDKILPVMVIISKLMFEDETSKDIKKLHVITPNLMQAFFGRDESLDKDHSLRLVVGEALSKVVAENTGLCMEILQEKGYDIIGDLKKMLQHDKYTVVATRLLWTLCAYYQDKEHPRLSEHLSSVLRVVLARMVDAEGEQLEVLIITALQLCNIIPKKFVGELESCTNKDKLVRKLVDALNSNKKISHQCPTLRRVIVEITISIVELCPCYSTIFKDTRMMEALSKEERTLAEVKKYKALLGDKEVFFDSGLPPPALVMKAKRLICSETPSQEAQLHDSSSLDTIHAS